MQCCHHHLFARCRTHNTARVVACLMGAASAFVAMSQTIDVDFSDERQTIVAMGLNMEGYHQNGGTEVLKNSVNEMLQMIPSSTIRIGMPLKEWEPANDNDFPGQTDWNRFKLTSAVTNSFQRLSKVKAMGKSIWLSVWDVADWNVTKPSSGNNRHIKDMDEFVESICSYLVYAKQHYGVDVDFVSVNEPTIASETGYGGYNIGLSADEQADLITKGTDAFRQAGLPTRWIMSMHSIYPSELRQMQAIYERVGTYVAAIDYHGYWLQRSERLSDLCALSEWISILDIPAVCGELDYDNTFWERTSDDKRQWKTHGMQTATLYALLFNEGRTSGSFPWYSNRPNANTSYRYVALHYHTHLPVGSVVVGNHSDNSSIHVVATKHGDDWTLLVQNAGAAAQNVILRGLPPSVAHVVASYDGHYGVTLDDIVVSNDGTASLPLKPYSLYSIGTAVIGLAETITMNDDDDDASQTPLLEAEDGQYGGGTWFSTSQIGFSGNGYIDFGGKNSYATFEIHCDDAGEYNLCVCYASGNARPCDVIVNGAHAGTFSFSPTPSWNDWHEEALLVTLSQGVNVISILANSDAGGPNVDYYRWYQPTSVNALPAPIIAITVYSLSGQCLCRALSQQQLMAEPSLRQQTVILRYTFENGNQVPVKQYIP